MRKEAKKVTLSSKDRNEILRFLVAFVLYGLLVAGSFFDNSLYLSEPILVLAICSLQAFRMAMRGYTSSLAFTLSICSIFLFILPSIAITHILSINIIPSLASFILISDIYLRLAQYSKSDLGTQLLSAQGKINLRLILFFLLTWCSLASSIVSADGFLGLLLFLAPFSAAIVVFEKLIKKHSFKLEIYLWLLLFLLVLAIYLRLYWSGYGRLVVGTLLLCPFLVANAQKDIGLRLYFIILASPIALYVAQVSRYGQIDDFSKLFIGSAGHHLIVTHNVLTRDDYVYNGGISAFIEQYSLMFLNWVPRAWWPEKPLGIGLWSVDVMGERAGRPEEYTQSIGFLGEQYLLLGPNWWLGMVIALFTLVFLRKVIIKYSLGYSAPVVIFDVNLISFFWGGFATFGSRVWFMLIPALIVVWMLKFKFRLSSPQLQQHEKLTNQQAAFRDSGNKPVEMSVASNSATSRK